MTLEFATLVLGTIRSRMRAHLEGARLGARRAVVWPAAGNARWFGRLAAVLGLIAAACATAWSQDSLRLSLAGEDAAEARRNAATTLDYYNLSLGRSAWSFGAGLGIQASDNLRGDATAPQSDIIFRPELDTRMRLAVSQVNTLNFSLGAGYAFYVAHPQYDRPFITPGSELSLDVYAGDFWINVHDRFAVVENGYLDPTVTGVGDYERLDNTAGLSGVWDLNKVVVKFGYDHLSYTSLGQNQGAATDGSSEVFSTSGGYTLKPGLLMGVELGGALLHYSASANGGMFSDGAEWSAGGFVDDKLTEHLQVHASAGYTSFRPESGLAAALGQEFSGIYAEVGARNRLNQFVDYALSGGRMLNFGFFGGLLDQYFARLDANWHIFRKTSLTTSFSYQHGSQLGFGAETFDWFGPGLAFSRRLTTQLTGSVGYQFYWRGSDLPGRDYTANVASATLLYKF